MTSRRPGPGRFGLPQISAALLLLCFVGLVLPASLSADTLGRLFFSPQDRIYMDKLRSSPPEPERTLRKADQGPPSSQPQPQVYTLDGTVADKDGIRAIWLNNIKYSGPDLPPNISAPRPFTSGRIILRVPETGKSYLLRPGQSIDTGSGVITESYERGSAGTPQDSKNPDSSSSEPPPQAVVPSASSPSPPVSGTP